MNITSDKKEKEYKILQKIFKNATKTEETETPDFIIENYIGVEITSFYHSEVSAMLANDDDFRKEVCEKSTFKNKKFLKDAPIFVSFESSYFEITPKKGVMIKNYPEKLKDIILRKNKFNYHKERPNLKKLYLVIQCKEHLFIIVDNFIEDLFNLIELNACEEIFDTQFEKIYFIIEYNNKEYFFDVEETTFFILCHLFNYFYFKYNYLKKIKWITVFKDFQNFCSKFGIYKIKNNLRNTIIKYKEYEFELFKSFEIDFGICSVSEIDIGAFVRFIKDNISEFKIECDKLKIKEVL